MNENQLKWKNINADQLKFMWSFVAWFLWKAMVAPPLEFMGSIGCYLSSAASIWKKLSNTRKMKKKWAPKSNVPKLVNKQCKSNRFPRSRFQTILESWMSDLGPKPSTQKGWLRPSSTYISILFFRACGRSWWTEDNQNDVLLVCLRYMASTGP